jgi:hypothetical protein
VKFLVSKNELKVPYEEYYYINEINGDIIHRKCNWGEFLYERGWDNIIKDALKYHGEIFNLELKFKNI